MGCACKVNKQINYLHKHYGHKVNVTKKEEREFKIIEFLRQLLIFLITIVSLPFMILFVIFTFFKKDKTTKIDKRWLKPIKV